MKRLFLCITLLMTLCAEGFTQNIIIGEKLPSDVRQRRWLMDMQPEAADYTCILFYHSESPLCQRALMAIKPLVEQYGEQLNLVVITKEEYDKAGVALTEHLDDRIGIAFDDGGKAFRQLGVTFIPFCVVCDKKRHALWCGNGAMFTAEVMDKILTTK
ncbi:MAG: conjugal transfer protein TraF [Alistipes sp.]|nr:conjugal transfer protein TraF [Alistipes sp.]